MRRAAGSWLLAVGLSIPTAVAAQRPSLLRDLPPLHVVVERLRVPYSVLSEEGAEDLRLRAIKDLRANGLPVVDASPSTTPFAGLADLSQSPFGEPTLIVSINMIPDGSAFVANIVVTLPVGLSGGENKVVVGAYTSRSYVYLGTWVHHEPVINYLQDFVDAWRAANSGRQSARPVLRGARVERAGSCDLQRAGAAWRRDSWFSVARTRSC